MSFARHLQEKPYLEQWERIYRWHGRLCSAFSKVDTDADDAMDVCLALFMNIYHLRDWIMAYQSSLKPHLNSLFDANRCLQLARDLCNGSKHLQLNPSRVSVDANFLTCREYVPPPISGKQIGPHYKLLMLADGDKTDLFEMAHECIQSWGRFM